MQYIDKNQDSIIGNDVTTEYLNTIIANNKGIVSYSVDYDGSFKNLQYPGSTISFYEKMTNVLISNQNGYCCYCMRRISNVDDTTLEHIMPQSLDNLYRKKEINDLQKEKYYYRRCNLLASNKIKLSVIFNRTNNPLYPPFPHTVAYNNLVASCLGEFPYIELLHNNEIASGDKIHSCNNERGKKKAFPIYFIPTIAGEIVYHKNGDISPSVFSIYDSKIKDVISSAKLTCQSLIDIRQMWYLMHNISIYQIQNCSNDNEARRKLIQKVLMKGHIEKNRYHILSQKFMKKNFWDTLMLYDWFHTYNWQ